MSDGALLGRWGGHGHLAELHQLATQGAQAGSVNAVIVGQQNAHDNLPEGKSARLIRMQCFRLRSACAGAGDGSVEGSDVVRRERIAEAATRRNAGSGEWARYRPGERSPRHVWPVKSGQAAQWQGCEKLRAPR